MPLLELLGGAAYLATPNERVAPSRVSVAVAAFSLFFSGAVFGMPAALLMPGVPSFLAIAIAFLSLLLLLLLLLLVAKLLGAEVGCSSSWKASVGMR